MDKLLIEGGFQLNGSVTASGAKNSALPILASSILLKDKLTLSNIPHLSTMRCHVDIPLLAILEWLCCILCKDAWLL